MAGSSCEREQSIRNAYERAIAGIGCLKDLDFFETMCRILNIPMETKKIWARRRLMPWFRANMIVWLYEYAKKHISKHSRVYSAYQLDIAAGAFKRALVTHRNAVTTAVKRTSRTSECDGREREEMLKGDLERNVTLCLHNSFCRNRENKVDPLLCCKQRVEEQKCWRTASNSVRITTTCCKTLRLKVRSQCRRERRWNINK